MSIAEHGYGNSASEPDITSDEVRDHRFTASRGHGYRQRDVDELMELAAHALRAHENGQPTADDLNARDIAAARLRTASLLTAAYDEVEVDAYLDRVCDALTSLDESDGREQVSGDQV